MAGRTPGSLTRHTTALLVFAFAFAVVADPGSSVAYAIEAALRALPTLVVNPARGYPLIAIGGTIVVAAFLYWRWVRAGRPRGIEAIKRDGRPRKASPSSTPGPLLSETSLLSP